MNRLHWLGYASVMLATAAQCALGLPDRATVEETIRPYLSVPLPEVKQVVGATIPAPAPMIVIASLGDDGAVAALDRGFAVGATLTDLLFDADPKLDTLPSWYYIYHVTKVGAPTGHERDSAANSYRAGTRAAAQWCAHGRVTGEKTVTVDLVIDGCRANVSSHQKRWTIKDEQEWSPALAEMCEFALASAVGELSARGRQSCARGRSIRSTSLLAFARYGGPVEKRSRAPLEALLSADPAFGAGTVEYLSKLPFEEATGDAYWLRIGKVAQGAPQSSATQLRAFSQASQHFGARLDVDVYQRFAKWIRDHPYLYAGWSEFGTALAIAPATVWPVKGPPKAGSTDPPDQPANFPPNEATHAASVAIALAIYGNWPNSFQSMWLMGRALSGYAWMVRGHKSGAGVTPAAFRTFRGLIPVADRFYSAALDLHPDADWMWSDHIGLLATQGKDWMPAFDHAVELNPTYQPLYETAMNFASDKWGGTEAMRNKVESVARAKNHDAPWTRALRAYYQTPVAPPN